MTFHSILFTEVADDQKTEMPAFFGDLHLDQVINTIIAGKQDYHLQPFFYTSLKNIDAILYRHEIMQDLEHRQLYEQIQAFARTMRTMREHLAQADKLHYLYQKERWFLDAVELYCVAVQDLEQHLSQAEIQSRGLLAFLDYMKIYVHSEQFTSLQQETHALKADLSAVAYCLLVQGSSVKVRRYDAEVNYSAEVAHTFEKFKQGDVKDYTVKFSTWPDMNHVEANILSLVARLYPDLFSHLNDYCARNNQYLDETIAVFDREIQFYLAYLDYMALFKQKGLPFCYPRLSTTRKDVSNREGFDIALAYQRVLENAPIVCNDFFLERQERIIVVTGPNQGGKTTFARAFGQIHYLASLGCPVPGKEAQLLLFDGLFTHFEKEEAIENLRGKLQDELIRIDAILNQATPSSIIILNEIFTSTTVNDALFLSKKILGNIHRLDLLCVCVTFLDELASFSEKTVSMVSRIVPDHPELRTYKIVRKPADGRAYAIAIAEKYRLTYDNIKERISS